MNIPFTGTVIHGDKIGNPFGVATANIEPQPHTPLKSGVYLVEVSFHKKNTQNSEFSKTNSSRKKRKNEAIHTDIVCEQGFFSSDKEMCRFSGLMHYGELKTFGRNFRIEIHLLDFDQNIYEQTITIHPLKYLREVQKFQNADLLFTQIENDIVKARKYFLRQHIWKQWNNVSKEEKEIMNNKIVQYLQTHQPFITAQNIGFYHPMPKKEISFEALLLKTFPDKQYFFPETNASDKSMIFVEEKTNKQQPIALLDFMIVPLVAGNKKGQRLGQGGGYYDRILTEYEGVTIGFVPSFAYQEDIPTEKHDQTIDKIVSI